MVAPISSPLLVGLLPVPCTRLIGREAEVATAQSLLLGNCEHLLSGMAAVLGRVLAACPAVQVLATSRAPLHVRAEQEFPVNPLPLSVSMAPSLEALLHNEVVRPRQANCAV